MSAPGRRVRVRLWWKLAAMAALGVVVMHVIHLTLGMRIASRAMAFEQERLGHTIARLVADQAVEALLVDDVVALDEIASSAVSADRRGVAYCFIARDGRVVASSFDGPVPASLLSVRAAGDRAPLIVVRDGTRVLDLTEPVLGGVGEVRVGLGMGQVADVRRQLAEQLGLLALAVILAGLVAALVMGRSIARPIHAILVSADRFDPSEAGETPLVTPRGTDEIAELGDRFNRMMVRLRSAHRDQERARQKSIETERMVALGSLVAGVAHEVNNPLAGLKNCVNRLSRPDLPAAKREEYLQLMEEGLARIQAVVTALLDFARPHAPSLQPVSAAELARKAVSLVSPALGRMRIGCRLEDERRDGLVLADRHAIGQALVNLLLNAAYASPDGAQVRLRLLERDGLRGIAVEDDGPGIPLDIRGRVLDPFFTTKPPGEGTGLGLSVTKTIVDAHEGELTFDFPERGGTVVTVWLRSAPSGAQRLATP